MQNADNTFRNFLWSISDSGFYFALFTSPFMLLLAGVIAFSNIWLMRHESRRLLNALGIAFGILWFIGTANTVGSATVGLININKLTNNQGLK